MKGYAKTLVRAGGSVGVEIALAADAFAYYSTATDGWRTDDGIYEILIGASSRDIRLTAKVKVENGKASLLS